MNGNLLPWRQQRDQRIIRVFLYRFLAILVFFLFCGFFIIHHFQQIERNNQRLEQQITDQQFALEKWQQKITELADSLPSKQQENPLTSEQSLALFQLLQDLPLQQGVLQRLNWQKGELQLQGFAKNQLAFDELDRFLRQAKIVQKAHLKTFHTTANYILFDFRLQLKEE